MRLLMWRWKVTNEEKANELLSNAVKEVNKKTLYPDEVISHLDSEIKPLFARVESEAYYKALKECKKLLRKEIDGDESKQNKTVRLNRGYNEDTLVDLKAKQAIEIINQDIQDLEKVFYNRHIFSYLKDSQIHSLLEDLYKIKRYVEKKKGTISIVKITSKLSFKVLDDNYYKTLYHVPKVNIKKEIYTILSDLLAHRGEKIKLKKILGNFFRSNTYRMIDFK